MAKDSAKKYHIDRDNVYGNRRNYNILDDLNAEPAISIRINASNLSK
jgi:hypothetical protein